MALDRRQDSLEAWIHANRYDLRSEQFLLRTETVLTSISVSSSNSIFSGFTSRWISRCPCAYWSAEAACWTELFITGLRCKGGEKRDKLGLMSKIVRHPWDEDGCSFQMASRA